MPSLSQLLPRLLPLSSPSDTATATDTLSPSQLLPRLLLPPSSPLDTATATVLASALVVSAMAATVMDMATAMDTPSLFQLLPRINPVHVVRTSSMCGWIADYVPYGIAQ
ncbi:hypothetical protein MRX96_019464 [Rhipicephalus microplus]